MDKFIAGVRLKVGSPGSDPATAFGKGTAALLRGVDATGSLNRAAAGMGMAYSKAWTGINKTEEQLGFKLIDRQAQHGSVLTQRGRRLLEIYDKAERAAERAAQAVLDEAEI